MDKAISLSYVLKVPIGQMAISLDARIVYFPDQQVLIKPIVTISPLGEVLEYERPEIKYDSEAEELYNSFKGRLEGKDVTEVEVPGHMLAWAVINPDSAPTKKFYNDLYRFLLPYPPETTEAEKMNVKGEGLDILVSSIYVPSHQLLLKYESRRDGEASNPKTTLQYGQEATDSYLILSNLATQRNIVHILNPFLAMIKDLTEKDALSVSQSLVEHVRNLAEPH